MKIRSNVIVLTAAIIVGTSLLALNLTSCMLLGGHAIGMTGSGCGMGTHGMNHSMDSESVERITSDTSGSGSGTVRAIDRSAKTITIKHGNIPGVMAAMTMAYSVADTTMLDDVHVGDAVTFLLKQKGTEYQITSLAGESAHDKH